jgi:hypothetical protein
VDIASAAAQNTQPTRDEPFERHVPAALRGITEAVALRRRTRQALRRGEQVSDPYGLWVDTSCCRTLSCFR